MPAATDLIRKLPSAYDAEKAGGMDCTIQFNISTPMHLVVADGHCESREGPAASPDVTITMEDDDLVALMTRELNAMTALMTGKLTVDGDLILGQQVLGAFDASKLV